MVKLLHRRHPTQEPPGDSGPEPGTVVEAAATAEPEVITAQRHQLAPTVPPTTRRSVMRVPTYSPAAPILGVLLSWGAIATATSILDRAEIDTGFNLGIANGGVVGDDRFLAGLWLLLVSFGAFLVGGYAAARIARAHGAVYATLMWVIAMVATAVDAIVETATDGTQGVIQQLGGVPFWAESGLTHGYERTVVFVIFAGAQLVGSLAGGGLGQLANRRERSDDVVVMHEPPDDASAPVASFEQATQPGLSGEPVDHQPSGEVAPSATSPDITREPQPSNGWIFDDERSSHEPPPPR